MRRLCIGMVVAAAALVPVWAVAGNQEVAERIAANLRESGQLHGYKIGVKFQDGTAWLRGRVSSRAQLNTALRLVLQTPGISRVVNNLQIAVGDTVAPPATGSPARDPASNSQAAPHDVQPLQQAAGAIAPERLSRPVTADLAATTAQRVPSVSQAAATLQQVVANAAEKLKRPAVVEPPMKATKPSSSAEADRVATSFAEQPAQQTTAQAIKQAPATASYGMMASRRAIPRVATQPAATMPGQPIPVAFTQAAAPMPIGQPNGGPLPQYVTPPAAAATPARYDQPHVPNYAWPSYAAYPNYAGLTYPKQYSPTVWPYIGPFYPYPQVPLGWRKVTLEWHDGWWHLDFDSGTRRNCLSGLFRPNR